MSLRMVFPSLLLMLWICCSITPAYCQKPKRPTTNLTPEITQLIITVAERHGLPPLLILEVIRQESSFRKNALSPKNAQGLMQFIPATAMRFGVKDPFDPKQAIEGGCRYLVFLAKLFNGNLALMLAAYNCGEDRVMKINRVPNIAETQNYVRSIIRAYRRACQLEKELQGKEVERKKMGKKEATKKVLYLDRYLSNHIKLVD